jgi:predicted enzyme related to lactoylglutathione lyase
VERVTGIGGYFMRSEDPDALMRWYTEHLGIPHFTTELWHQEAGPTVFAPFGADTTYFGRMDKQTMINFRVRDLDAMLAQLRAGGADVGDEIEVDEAGRFCFVTDPEGNRIQLWEPSKETPAT